MKREDMKFVRQSQTIKVINVDNKVQTEKESMETCRFLYWCMMFTLMFTRNHLRSIELRQNKRVGKFAEKFTWHTFQERVSVFEVIATVKIPILGDFISTD